MADHVQLETTVQDLLVKLAYATDGQRGERIASRERYLDVSINIADFRANRTDETAAALARSAEALLCDLDDISHSDSPEWEAASKAVDPYVK